MSKRQPRLMTNEECRRFMKGLTDLPTQARAYLLLLFFMCARPAEARRLAWADIDVDQQFWRKRDVTNGAKTRLLPLPSPIIDAFASLPRESPWVFPDKNGQPWSAYRVTNLWRAFCAQNGLDDVPLSALRLTYAMRLALSDRSDE